MNKYLVIGNPIEHSLSPKLHNYWIQKNNLNAIYEKKRVNINELKDIIFEIKQKKITGINVTIPFKQSIIPYLDKLSYEADKTKSVNTILLENDKVIGHNTDIEGFELAIKNLDYDISNKKILILGAGGVVPSLIFALNKMSVSEIIISNRTRENAENLKKNFKKIKIINWGESSDFDVVINATSIGLKHNDKMNLDFSNIGKNKLFFDVIYNPKKTNFLEIAEKLGNKFENGKSMFIFQALLAFKLWHKIIPKVDKETMSIFDS